MRKRLLSIIIFVAFLVNLLNAGIIYAGSSHVDTKTILEDSIVYNEKGSTGSGSGKNSFTIDRACLKISIIKMLQKTYEESSTLAFDRHLPFSISPAQSIQIAKSKTLFSQFIKYPMRDSNNYKIPQENYDQEFKITSNNWEFCTTGMYPIYIGSKGIGTTQEDFYASKLVEIPKGTYNKIYNIYTQNISSYYITAQDIKEALKSLNSKQARIRDMAIDRAQQNDINILNTSIVNDIVKGALNDVNKLIDAKDFKLLLTVNFYKFDKEHKFLLGKDIIKDILKMLPEKEVQGKEAKLKQFVHNVAIMQFFIELMKRKYGKAFVLPDIFQTTDEVGYALLIELPQQCKLGNGYRFLTRNTIIKLMEPDINEESSRGTGNYKKLTNFRDLNHKIIFSSRFKPKIKSYIGSDPYEHIMQKSFGKYPTVSGKILYTGPTNKGEKTGENSDIYGFGTISTFDYAEVPTEEVETGLSQLILSISKGKIQKQLSSYLRLSNKGWDKINKFGQKYKTFFDIPGNTTGDGGILLYNKGVKLLASLPTKSDILLADNNSSDTNNRTEHLILTREDFVNMSLPYLNDVYGGLFDVYVVKVKREALLNENNYKGVDYDTYIKAKEILDSSTSTIFNKVEALNSLINLYISKEYILKLLSDTTKGYNGYIVDKSSKTVERVVDSLLTIEGVDILYDEVKKGVLGGFMNQYDWVKSYRYNFVNENVKRVQYLWDILPSDFKIQIEDDTWATILIVYHDIQRNLIIRRVDNNNNNNVQVLSSITDVKQFFGVDGGVESNEKDIDNITPELRAAIVKAYGVKDNELSNIKIQSAYISNQYQNIEELKRGIIGSNFRRLSFDGNKWAEAINGEYNRINNGAFSPYISIVIDTYYAPPPPISFDIKLPWNYLTRKREIEFTNYYSHGLTYIPVTFFGIDSSGKPYSYTRYLLANTIHSNDSNFNFIYKISVGEGRNYVANDGIFKIKPSFWNISNSPGTGDNSKGVYYNPSDSSIIYFNTKYGLIFKREQYRPVLAQYKYKNYLDMIEKLKRGLGLSIGNKVNSSYIVKENRYVKDVIVTENLDAGSDKTILVYPYPYSSNHRSQRQFPSTSNLTTIKLGIYTFSGKGKDASNLPYKTRDGYNRLVVNTGQSIKFYPYFKMYYVDNNTQNEDAEAKSVYVLDDNKSSISVNITVDTKANDIISNEDKKGSYLSFDYKDTNWVIAKRAYEILKDKLGSKVIIPDFGSSSWMKYANSSSYMNKANAVRVVAGDSRVVLNKSTGSFDLELWIPVIPDRLSDAATGFMTYSQAKEWLSSFKEQLQKKFNNLDLVLYVNKDIKDKPINGVKITKETVKSSKVKNYFKQNKFSTAGKYYFDKNKRTSKYGSKIKSTIDMDIDYYEVRKDADKNDVDVVLVDSEGRIINEDLIEKATGLKKALKNVLDNIEMEDEYYVVDFNNEKGKYYVEYWDGIGIVRAKLKINVEVPEKEIVIDPYLCPKLDNKEDMLKKFYIACFTFDRDEVVTDDIQINNRKYSLADIFGDSFDDLFTGQSFFISNINIDDNIATGW